MNLLKPSITLSICLLLMSCSFNQPNVNNQNQTSNSAFKVKSIYQSSEGFNEEAYLYAFGDVVQAINNGDYQTGYQHYLAVGKNQGRLGWQDYLTAKQAVEDGFNEEAYLLAFPAVKQALDNHTPDFANAYQHYIFWGKTDPVDHQPYLQRTEYIQAKNTVNVFNEEAYLLAFPDIVSAIHNGTLSSAYDHYLITGKVEGRINNPYYIQVLQDIRDGFNEKAYLYAFPLVKQALDNHNPDFSSAYQHYIYWGKTDPQPYLQRIEYIQAKQAVDEGFDEQTYLLAFDDVRHQVFSGVIPSAYWHYINKAPIERKTLTSERYQLAKEGFNEEAYLLTYPDIEAGVNSGAIPSAYWHYSKYARFYEGRMVGIYNRIKDAIASGYNEKAYIQTFDDIRNDVFYGNYRNGVLHYIDYGINEHRLENPTYKINYQNIVSTYTTGVIGFD